MEVNKLDQAIDNIISPFFKAPLVQGVVHLILMLYAARVAPRPPQAVLDLFQNQYFKLFFFSLILWTAQFTPSTALLISISFLITMNYFNNKALFEFMENAEDTTAPIAPSKDVALETSAAIVETQMQEPTVVQSVTQTPETIVVQPSIVQTSDGTTVQTPTVVVAPAVVTNEQGETMIVKPDVTLLELPSQQPAPEAPQPEMVVQPEQKAAVDAVSTLANAAASSQPSSPQQVAELTQTAVSAVTTTEAKEAVEQLAQQAVKPEAAPVEAVKETATVIVQDIMAPPVPQEQPKEDMAACYPIRRYDMSKVSPYGENSFYGSI